MKHLLALFLVFVLVFSLNATPSENAAPDNGLADKNSDMRIKQPDRAPLRDDPNDVEVFIEGFEEGMGDWVSTDLTNPDTSWHKSDFLGEEDDLAWWCGDTLEGYEDDPVGYDNSWLQYLDTPVLDLSGAEDGLTMTFSSYWLLEDPRRVPPRQPIDGWDGWLVMISEDGGENFEPIRPESPEYHADRISAAENWWDLGPTPGWVFESGDWDAQNDTTPEPDWVDVEFDLSDYAAEDIVIRFALISDRAVAAPWNYYLRNSGVIIDDLVIQDGQENIFLFNNADDDPVPEELIPRRGPGFGDYWEIVEGESHSGQFSMHNDPAYNSLQNALDSPPFEVPEDINVFFQFWVYCNLEDADGDGNNQLEDFYQVFLSDDEGETWQWQATAYNRTGGDDWAHYVPGTPYGDANIDLDLTEWAGQTVQLRWLFRTDHNDDGGVGEGLFIDDIEVLGVDRQAVDAGMTNLILPFPTTVGHRTEDFRVTVHNWGLRPLDAIWAVWGWESAEGGRTYPIVPRPALETDESEEISLTDYADRRVPGWTPTAPGLYPVWAMTTVGSNTPGDPDDDDMSPENDSVGFAGVEVMPEGIFELGFDNRSTQYAYRFNEDEGPAARFTVDMTGNESGVLAQVKFLFNGLEENTNFNLHIFGEGEEENIPGERLLQMDVELPAEQTFPNWFTLPLWNQENPIEVTGDFWVWVELQQDTIPMIVGDEMVAGEGRYFRYDGNQAEAFQADLMIRPTVAPEPIMAAAIQASSNAIDFGEVPENEFAIREVSLFSTGFEPLIITNITTESEVFDVNFPGETTLNFTESMTIEILFEPGEVGFFEDVLVFDCNADETPRVDLIGSGAMDVPGENAPQPIEFGLAEPYPNPFNNATRINFSLDKPGRAMISLYDLAGRNVDTIVDRQYSTGSYAATYSNNTLPAGVYLLKLEAGSKSAVKKLILMK